MSVIARIFTNVLKNANDEERVLAKKNYSLTEGDEPLGVGSYAKVRLAYSTRLNKEVAVKIIDRRKAPTDFLQRFLPRELQIIPKLRHQHIVQVRYIRTTVNTSLLIIFSNTNLYYLKM